VGGDELSSFVLGSPIGNIAGFGAAVFATGLEGGVDGFEEPELPRPSEYPKPKNTPQMSTRPKKTPSNDLIPSVISVSVCSCSSGS
jgi:hypothetical protein